jgi:hypothetical protein
VRVVRRHLVVPRHLARVNVERNERARIQVVSRPSHTRVRGTRVPGAEDV